MDDKKEAKELKRTDKQIYNTESMQIPVGSADVKEMIAQKLYADKTDYITKLFKSNGIYYFFTRPRRLGKSLLLDTIDQIAKGNKALFKGCAIYKDQTYKWKKYPVIWLNFSELAKDNPTELKKSINRKLYKIAKVYKVQDKINVEIDEACEDYLEEVFDLLRQLDRGLSRRLCKMIFVVIILIFNYLLSSCNQKRKVLLIQSFKKR